jgi:hypothetical protein
MKGKEIANMIEIMAVDKAGNINPAMTYSGCTIVRAPDSTPPTIAACPLSTSGLFTNNGINKYTTWESTVTFLGGIEDKITTDPSKFSLTMDQKDSDLVVTHRVATENMDGGKNGVDRVTIKNPPSTPCLNSNVTSSLERSFKIFTGSSTKLNLEGGVDNIFDFVAWDETKGVPATTRVIIYRYVPETNNN